MSLHSSPPRRLTFAPFVAAIALCLSSAIASAVCLPYGDLELQTLDQLVHANPPIAEQRIKEALVAIPPTDRLRRAALLSLLVETYSIQEKHNDLRGAMEEAIPLVQDPTEPAALNLLSLEGGRALDEREVNASLRRAEAALKAQPKESPAEACALIGLGLLELVADRTDLASLHLTQAYRMSAGPDRLSQRIAAAGNLAIVMRALRDLPTAISLIREVRDSYQEQGAIYELAAAYNVEGFVLMEVGDREAARDALRKARDISSKLNDRVGIAYIDVNLCLNEIGMSNARRARVHCENAGKVFAGEAANEPRKRALTGLAEIELMENNPTGALAVLEDVLDQDGRDLPPFRLAKIYELRAKARRQLGLFRDALDDFENFMRRFIASKDDERAREAGAMRARFEIDRAIERNEFLQRQLESNKERLAAQSARLRWMIAAALASVAVIGLLTLLLLANRKKKRLLERMAREDELTGLPNRRYTLKRAAHALERLRRQHSPFTIGILDLDHFKRINDRFGHAAGDYVLKEFARIGRQSLRDTDLLGRWGGEEFLILLPDTSLDVALSVVERVRTAAGQIAGGPLPADFKVTLSAGLATNETPGADLEKIIAHADAALYNAKNRGRNLVLVAQESYDASPSQVRRTLKQAGIDLATGRFVIAS